MIDINEILSKYWIFRITNWMKLIKISSVGKQLNILSIICVLIIISIGFVDNSFFIEGSGLGLLEHPSIWFLITLQFILPYTLCKISQKLLNKNNYTHSIIDDTYFINEYPKVVNDFSDFICLKTALSKIIFSNLMAIGIICFAWNSFQNQRPIQFLGFDFWDSSNHLYGYLISRFYKLYLWVGVLPASSHIIIGFILLTQKMIKTARELNLIELKPYHQDGAGGSKIYVDTIIKPLSMPLICIIMLSFVVIIIHQKLDITVIMNLNFIALIFLLLYLIPILTLRKVIYEEKNKQLRKINLYQEEILKEFYKCDKTEKHKKEYVELLNELNSLLLKIKSVSTIPSLKYVVKIITIINSPTLLNLIQKYLISFIFNIKLGL